MASAWRSTRQRVALPPVMNGGTAGWCQGIPQPAGHLDSAVSPLRLAPTDLGRGRVAPIRRTRRPDNDVDKIHFR